MKHFAILNSKEGLTMKKFYVFGLALGLLILTATSLGFAADYDYKTMTPDIEKALKNRQARYYQLQSLKQEGVIGENNKGYVTDLKDNTTASTMVAAENKDRRVMYEALAEQNKLGNTGLLEVQKAFADVQSEKASPGDMVQSSSGDWKKKS
jgi:uncharacterized protein